MGERQQRRRSEQVSSSGADDEEEMPGAVEEEDWGGGGARFYAMSLGKVAEAIQYFEMKQRVELCSCFVPLHPLLLAAFINY